MTVLDLLLLIVFVSFIAYKVIKKKRDNKTSDNLTVISNKALECYNGTINQVYVSVVDCEKTDTPKLIALNISQAIDDYLENLDRIGNPKPTDIDFVSNFNRIFIVYKWR